MCQAFATQTLQSSGVNRVTDDSQRVLIRDRDVEFVSTLGRHVTKPNNKRRVIKLTINNALMLLHAFLAGFLTYRFVEFAKLADYYEQSYAETIMVLTIVGVVINVWSSKIFAIKVIDDAHLLWQTHRAR